LAQLVEQFAIADEMPILLQLPGPSENKTTPKMTGRATQSIPGPSPQSNKERWSQLSASAAA
jgi:hypothetical protein